MLSNDFKVLPHPKGDPMEKLAYEILQIDSHAVVPSDLKGARRMLAELQQRGGLLVPGPSGRRLNELHALHNGNLSRLALAKRIGVRSPDTKAPELPSDGLVSEDKLQKAREFWSALDADIEAFQSTTPEQRRIMRLETRLQAVIEHANNLVTAMLDYEQRIQRLEAVIKGPQAA